MVKNLPASAGNTSSTPGLERSPGVGNGNLLQYSCLEDAMDREAWWSWGYNPWGYKESETTEHACKNLVKLNSLFFNLQTTYISKS